LFKFCIALVFMGTLLGGLTYQLSVCYNFFSNQEEIAESFCENRDVPILNCNGKCYLAKLLKKSNRSSNKKVPAHQIKINSFIFCDEISGIQPLLLNRITRFFGEYQVIEIFNQPDPFPPDFVRLS